MEYSIKQIASKLNKSERSVYRFLTSLDREFLSSNTKIINKKKIYNESVFNLVFEHFSDSENVPKNDFHSQDIYNYSTEKEKENKSDITSNSDIVNSLLKQLAEKDRQISFLENHISELTTMNKNFQVLLNDSNKKLLSSAIDVKENKKFGIFSIFKKH